MSLFSRLEERMRARDSQDDSKEKEAASADDGQGGLFGSVQLKPARDEASVPPPAGVAGAGDKSGIAVPTLEEARAELDRIRAENAQNAQGGQSSGLFRRDKAPADDATETMRAPAAASGARESVSFGAVELPPRTPDETPAVSAPQSAPTTAPAPVEAPEAAPQIVAQDAVEGAPSGDKPFRVPSLSQFAESEDAPADAEAQEAEAQLAPALDAATSPTASVEQIVYAPVAPENVGPDERDVVARPDFQVGAPPNDGATTEESRSTEISAPAPAPEPVPEPASAVRFGERSVSAPATPPSNSSNLSPFQRLMAARAAQGGSPNTRPRNERLASAAPTARRPLAETPPEIASPTETPEMREAQLPATRTPDLEIPATPELEAPQSEAPQSEAPQSTAPSTEVRQTESPQVESPQTAALSLEDPETELPAAPAIEVPALDAPPSLDAPAPVAALDASPAPLQLPESSLSQSDENVVVPLVESAAISPDLSTEASVGEASVGEASVGEASVGEASVGEASDPMPETAAPAPEVAHPAEIESQTSEMEAMAMKADALVAQAREQKMLVSDATDEEDFAAEASPADAGTEEAETVPEEEATATAFGAEPSSEMPNSETAEPPARPTLSLAERLARTPRDAAPAETLAPEMLGNAAPTRDVAPPRSGSLSFAERLAARNKPQIEPPAPTAPPTPATPPATEAPATSAPATAPPARTPVEPMFTQPVPPFDAPDFSQNSDDSAEESAAPAPRSGPRSFTERLAARTTLDNHLQVPAPEGAPARQDLARHNTELARINDGADLSEREMKNRVLFRQKHLIFDHVIGALDQRTMQNPTRETAKPQIERGVDAALAEYGLDLEQSERNWLVDEFVREVTDLGALVPMLEDPSVNKIVVTGANDVSVERLGRIERTGVSFRDDDHLLSLVRRIAELSGGRVDAKVPLLDRPLPDGGRIRAKVPPLAPQPTLTIEKSTGNPFVVLKRQMDEKSRGDALPYAQLRERIQQRLLREFEGDAAALAGDQDKLRGQVEEMIGSVIAEEHVAVTRAERASLVMDLLNEIVGLGPIEPLLNDPDVDEVMVNGPYQIYVERKGKLELTSQRFRDNGHVMQVIDRIVAPLGRRVDEKSPMVDGRLRDGSRFNAIIPPLALSGPTMTIRKFARDPFTMSDLINFGTITREAAQFLQASVEGRLNIVVSGGTGSGKTTTLNVLSSFIPSTERIVTIEDAAELQMRQEHVIRMETRPPNIEGVGEVGIRDLVKNSLRMRPDRIVVGECRGGEALDMLQAMNTGHDGSLTTAHSNGPRDTCKRLETMVMMAGFDLPVRAIREQISMAVQLVVHQERMRDGKRRVTAITEIVGMEGDVLTLQDIFRFEQEGMDDDGRIIGSLQATGMRPKYYETIVDNGGTISVDIFTPKPHEAAPRARLNERGGR